MSFVDRKTTKNWAKVDYDRSRWIIVPLSFEGTKWGDLASWAMYYAEERGEREFGELTKKVMRKEIKPRAASFMDVHKDMVGKLPAQKFFFDWPEWTSVPVPVAVSIWQPQGTREEAFQYYAYWSVKDPQDLVTEWFETETLGTGVKTRWKAIEDGKPVWAVNYVFRNEEWETDVHVFTSWPVQERFEEVITDLDVLVRGIECCPRRSAAQPTS